MRIGVDLGGTKIEAVALNGAGVEIARRRVPTPAGDYEATIRAVVALVEGSKHDAGRRGTGGPYGTGGR